MATITFKGNPLHTVGTLPAVGSKAPPFKITAGDLSEQGLEAFAGKKKILNIVPSLDTGICQMSARRFNQEIAKLPNAVALNISADLPFAQKRFCDSEKLTNIHNFSVFRSPAFGKDFGVTITDGPLAGLLSRAVVVVDENNVVTYTEQVPEIAQEPNYDAALAKVK